MQMNLVEIDPVDCLVPRLVKISPMALRRVIVFKSQKCIFTNVTKEKKMAFHLNKLVSSSPKNALCEGWLEVAHWY